MKRTDLEKLSKEQLIEILNGVNELQVQLSITCNTLAQDLRFLNEGKAELMKILNSDEKYFERFIVLVKCRSDLNSLSLLPEPQEKIGTKKIKAGDNVFEHVIREVKRNGNPNV